MPPGHFLYVNRSLLATPLSHIIIIDCTDTSLYPLLRSHRHPYALHITIEMNVHGLSDIRPSKGTFDGETSKGNLWKRSYNNGPSGCRPPVLTRDETTSRGAAVQVYTGCADSPNYIGPDKTQWRLKTDYTVALKSSALGHDTLPKRISVLNCPEPKRPHVMSTVALWPPGSHEEWNAQLEKQDVRVITDQGSKVSGDMYMWLHFDPVGSAQTGQSWTLRDGLVDHLGPRMESDTAWSERSGPDVCPVPTTPNSWATSEGVKDYHVQIRTGGSYDTREDMNPVAELLKSKAAVLDEPFVLSGNETKRITVSRSPLIEVSLVPARKDRFTQYGSGRRLGN